MSQPFLDLFECTWSDIILLQSEVFAHDLSSCKKPPVHISVLHFRRRLLLQSLLQELQADHEWKNISYKRSSILLLRSLEFMIISLWFKHLWLWLVHALLSSKLDFPQTSFLRHLRLRFWMHFLLHFDQVVHSV